MASIYFTYLEVSEPNLTWNTAIWKARRITFTIITWDEAQRNTKSWFGTFRHSAV